MKLLKFTPAIALALLLSSCADSNQKDNVTNNADTMVLKSKDAPAPTPAAADEWAAIDWGSPVLKYDDVKSTNITVRGNDRYGIYGLGENILFETGKSTIKSSAEANLKEVAASIDQHYKGHIKVYGYTDTTGTAAGNMQLSRDRAAAVKTYLVDKAGIAADRITMYAEGERRPVADNSNATGREQNRRVEIVALKS